MAFFATIETKLRQGPCSLLYTKSGGIKTHGILSSPIVWYLHGSEIWGLTNTGHKEGPFQDMSTIVLNNT